MANPSRTSTRKRKGAPTASRADAQHDSGNDDDAVLAEAAEAAAASVGSGPEMPEMPGLGTAEAEAAAADPVDAAAVAVGAGTDVYSPPDPKTKRQRLSWNERFLQLKDYKAQHGHCNVTIRYKKNKTLGKWCNNMREQYKVYMKRMKAKEEGDESALRARPKCPMTADRIRLLEEVGFQWSTDREGNFDVLWEKKLSELQAYKAEHGNCMVPHAYKENPILAEWVHRQRCTYVEMKKREATGETLASKKKKGGKRTSDRDTDAIVKKRMAILEEMGFAFKVKEGTWAERLEELKQYKQTFGDCNVPITYAENPSLGRWVHTQRHQEKIRREQRNDGKRSSKSTMTDERFKLLNEIGMCWEVRAIKAPHRATWEDRFNELKVFYEANGHCVVPETNTALNRWCHDQKGYLEALDKDLNDVKGRKKLSSEKVQQLASIGFTSDTHVAAPHYTAPLIIEQIHGGTIEDAAAAAIAAAEEDCEEKEAAFTTHASV